MIEVQHYVLDNFIYWKNKEKTLFTLNICFAASAGLITLWFVSIRYLIVIGLWGVVSLSSPFFLALGKSMI